MTYTIAAFTVKDSWWWTEELSETCRDLFQEQIWEISTSSWFYYKTFITMHGHMNVKLSFSLANVNIYSQISNTVTRMSCHCTN